VTRILVTVSRSWSEWSTMRSVLARCHAEHPDAVLVHGAAPRGDSDAAGIWRGLGGQVEAWPAKWREHGPDCRCPKGDVTCRFAGMRRNLAMVESSPDLVVAFINKASKGATHCAKAAEGAGIPTVYYRQGEPS
jgi:hypothetical protein